MNNAVYGKTMENLRNRINVKLVSNKKDYLKWTSKPSYMSHKIFNNDLVVIRKSKVTLTLNKPGVAIKEFVGLKQKIYSYLVDDSKEHKKAKGINKNVVATSHNKYKDVLLNKKCLKHSMNRIQTKDHRIGTYEINKISLTCFDDKICIQNNGCDGLTLGY